MKPADPLDAEMGVLSLVVGVVRFDVNGAAVGARLRHQ